MNSFPSQEAGSNGGSEDIRSVLSKGSLHHRFARQISLHPEDCIGPTRILRYPRPAQEILVLRFRGSGSAGHVFANLFSVWALVQKEYY